MAPANPSLGSPRKPMNNRTYDADYALFRAEVEGAVPLRNEVVEPWRRRPPPIPRPRPPEADEDDPAGLSEAQLETHDFLSFSRPGVQRRLFDELQRGRIEPGLELDLHGLTAEHARAVLRAFLAACTAPEREAVLNQMKVKEPDNLKKYRTQIDKSLEDIRSRVLQMGGLVERQINQAIEALVDANIALGGAGATEK